MYIPNIREMKAISWNVNGIRAILGKNFLEYLREENPDMIGLQEVKAQWEQVAEKDKQAIAELGYKVYWNGAKRPGYSGTAVLSKKEPQNIIYGIDCEVLNCEDIKEYDETIHSNEEGRVTALEFDDFYFVTVYTPNSKDDLSRLDYRYHSWDKIYLKFLKKLKETKPVVTCGDFNVAHTEIDLARPAANTMSAGFTKEEREGMDNYIAHDLVDTFRYMYP